MNLQTFPRRRRARAQRGDVMLIVLVFLLVCLLGLVVSMRGSIVTTQLVGNNLMQQKDTQVADVALKQIEALIVATSAGQPLQLAIVNPGPQPAWYRDVPAGTAAPDATYWGSCATTNAGSATLSCASLPVTSNGTAVTNNGAAAPYTVLAVVQYTGRYDPNTCNITLLPNASYYDVYLRVIEAAGATTSTTETVYRLCTR